MSTTHVLSASCWCGKQRFVRRSEAKAIAKSRYPGHHMNAYRCGEFWHIGHTAQWKVRGLA